MKGLPCPPMLALGEACAGPGEEGPERREFLKGDRIVKCAVLTLAVLLSGCATGRVHHKIPVEQGDLRVGMPEAEVLRVLGKPDKVYPGGQARIATPYSMAHPSPVGVGPNGAKWVYEKLDPVIVIFLEHGEVIWLTTWE